MKRHGVYVNCDPDTLGFFAKANNFELSDCKKKLVRYFQSYAGRGISDILFSIFEQSSIVPTKVLTWRAEKYGRKTENGIPVDYSDDLGTLFVKGVRDVYAALGADGDDPYQILFDAAEDAGMHPWMTLRMNDAHYHGDKTAYLRGDIYYEAVENRWTIRDGNGYYDTCFDFGVPEIRGRMLDYIREQIRRYDCYGLELDFMREIYCFSDRFDTETRVSLMNDFIRTVRAALDAREAELGHSMKLCVRLMRDIAQNRLFGFDAETWVKEGLVDVLVPTSRWASTDSDLPIPAWKELCEGTKTEVCAGLEILALYPYNNTAETVRGFAKQYVDAGADQIYLNNYFCITSPEPDPAVVGPDGFYGKAWHDTAAADEICGNRRHLVTEQDIAPDGCERFSPLPVTFTGEMTLSVLTGSAAESEEMSIILGMEDGEEVPAVFLDGVQTEYAGETDDSFFRCPPEAYFNVPNPHEKTHFHLFRVPAFGRGTIRHVVRICVKNQLTIKTAEIVLRE